jgi:uncharacterized protein YcbK (DUF882 family)
MSDKLKYFSPSEFTMDGQPVFHKMNPAFLQLLDKCRELAGVPFVITSSYRSPSKNRRVGGSVGSMHLYGRAVDIECPDGATRWKIVKAAMSLGLSVGVMRSALHLDNREGIPTMFDYYPRYGEGVSADE